MTEEIESKKRGRGRPLGKVEPSRGALARDARILRIAIALLDLTPSNDCTRFNTTRQTFCKWLRGESQAPQSVFATLLDMVIKAVSSGRANYAAAERAKIEAERMAELEAEEQKRKKAANDEHVSDALKQIEKLNSKGDGK